MPIDLPPGEVAQTDPQPQAENQASSPAAPGREDRHIFIKPRQESGREITPQGSAGELKGKETRETHFSPELKQQYSTFLKNYVERLVNITSQPNGEETLRQILENPFHKHDSVIFNLLTKEIVRDNGTKGREIDFSRIDTFLDKPEGMMIANQLLEQQTALQVFALGYNVSLLPPGDRDPALFGQLDQLMVRTGMDQGLLNRLWFNTVYPWLAQRVDLTGGRPNQEFNIAGIFRNPPRRLEQLQGLWATTRLGALFGALLGRNPAGFGIGAAAGLLGPLAINGVDHLIQQGVVYDFHQCESAFRSVANTDVERTYLQAVAGIHTEDFVFAGNQVQLAPNRIPLTDRVSELRKAILSNLYTRHEFYTKGLNIPDKDLDALPEQYLFRYMDGRPEQIGSTVGDRINTAFAQKGGIRDMADLPPTDPGFNVNNLNFQGNLERFMEARYQVINELTAELIKKYSGEFAPQNGVRKQVEAVLGQKKASRESGSKLQERRGEYEKRKTALEGDKGSLTGEKDSFTPYEAALSELNAARADLARRLIRTFGGQFNNVEEAVNRLREVIIWDPQQAQGVQQAPAPQVMIDGVQVRPVRERLVAIDHERQNRVNNLNQNLQQGQNESQAHFDRRLDNEEGRINEWAQGQEALVAQDVNKINGLVAELQQLQADIETKETRLADGESIVVNVTQALEPLPQQFDAITGWNGVVAGADLTEQDLLGQPLDEIMRRINEVYQADPAQVPPRGWPAEQNDLPENRMRVIHAMIEARARQNYPDMAGQMPDFRAITGWGITPNQLRVLSESELNVRINALNQLDPNVGWSPNENAGHRQELLNAIRDAKGIFRARYGALEQRIKDTQTMINNETAAGGRVSFKDEVERLSLIITTMSDYGDIRARAMETGENLGLLTSTQLATAVGTDTLSEAEQAQYDGEQLRNGYLEFMNVIFRYRDSTLHPERNDYFKQIVEVLPQNKFAEYMNDFFNLNVAPVNGVYDIDQILYEVSVDMGLGQIGSFEISDAIGNIIDRLGSEAAAAT